MGFPQYGAAIDHDGTGRSCVVRLDVGELAEPRRLRLGGIGKANLALIAAPVRENGRLFYADLQLGTINVFTLPQFGSEILPSGLTVHGFGQDADGELYALATNTSANGTGGVVYKLFSVRLAFQVSGNLLDISWPVAGGRLQTQTNSPGVGLGTNWVTVPNSAATNRVVVPIDPANGSVFYRLALP